MECRCLSSDNRSSGHHYDTDRSCSALVPPEAFASEVPEKGFFREKTETRGVFKSEDRNFFQVSPPGDLSECQQLSGAVCGSHFCKFATVFRHAPAVYAGSLSDGDPGEYAGEIPVHTFGSGKCLFWE